MTLRVRYAETDQMQRVYYGRYLEWFEAARGEFCRQRGVRYGEIERERGLFLPVLEAHCRYIAPARYDDEVRIEVFVFERRSRTMRMGYRAYVEDKLIAEGDTAHILVNAEGRACTWPPDLAACFL